MLTLPVYSPYFPCNPLSKHARMEYLLYTGSNGMLYEDKIVGCTGVYTFATKT